jgi:hypothetical protein
MSPDPQLSEPWLSFLADISLPTCDRFPPVRDDIANGFDGMLASHPDLRLDGRVVLTITCYTCNDESSR